PEAISFPRAMRDQGYDFSFSGLKTSVLTWWRRHPDAEVADVAASFQEAVVDVLVAKAMRAVAGTGARALAIGGGVAANTPLRERVSKACAAAGVGAFVPSRWLCTDNAAMVAAAGWYRLGAGGPSPLDVGASPNLAFPG
ncbi:MAG: tRNA (adenosine(37)-N6)-threonylcarbamoyltransferase complex transferase subunit TsaD, partial [Acidimicrobiales bacterium]